MCSKRSSTNPYRALALTALIAGLIAIFPFASPAQMMAGAGPDMMEGGPMGEPDLPMFLRAANLRPNQRVQAQQILDHNHAAFAHLFDQMHATREQLDDKLFAAGDVDKDAIEKSSAKLAQLQAQLAHLELETALRIRALLSPDQLRRVAEFHSKLESLHQQIHDLMQENMPPGAALMGPPPGPHPPGPLPSSEPPGE